MSTYNVPIIPLNLRKEETIVQIAESLNYLAEVSNDIFKKINKRIDQNSSHLKILDARISNVNSKISNVSGAKRAIQVFSSSKYPAAEINKPYNTVFTKESSLVPKKEKFYTKYKDVQPKEEPIETLQFYHLNFNDAQKTSLDGLGAIPENCIDGVNDLLLYNTGTNLYSKYVIADTLKVLQKAKKEAVNEGPEIGAAPLSISEPSAVPKLPGESFSYSPHLGDVPTIDVPIDLPDLPGIADDLRYTYNSDPTIAPSVITSPNLPELELPEILNETQDTDVIPTMEVATVTPPRVSVPEIAKQPEVPQTPIKTTPEPEISHRIEEKPIQEEPITPIQKPTEKEASQKNDAHASLMDAIRKAGGMKKLRSTEEHQESIPQPSKAKPVPAGGDLMADLHSKLLLRRKGISGTKKTNDIEPGSAMGKIAAMLPPPPAKTEQSESGTTDDDWDD